mmetsp:Transcript_28807/g.72991  ORF Transcript_28807/g.72991 Transcript_28807/m.72991 type:complete len:612 (+) Transcript_28807:137-1972(+)
MTLQREASTDRLMKLVEDADVKLSASESDGDARLRDMLRGMIEETLAKKMEEQTTRLQGLLRGYAADVPSPARAKPAAPGPPRPTRPMLPGEVSDGHASREPPAVLAKLVQNAGADQWVEQRDTGSKTSTVTELVPELPVEKTGSAEKDLDPSGAWLAAVPSTMSNQRSAVRTSSYSRSATRILTSGAEAALTRRASGDRRSTWAAQEPGLRKTVATFVVSNPLVEFAVGMLIVLNSIFLGVQANHLAVNRTDQVPKWLIVSETVFCLLFTMEISARLYVFRLAFFLGRDWHWNLFDLFVVGMQLFNEVLAIFDIAVFSNLSFARVLKLLKMVRVIRIARIARVVRELRTLVSSIASSMKALIWTGMLLLLMIYMVGIFLTEVVADHRFHGTKTPYGDEVLEYYYGNLLLCMLSLFEAITGGVDWNDLTRPLIDEISPVLALLYVIYIGVAVLCLMNVVTGVFVDTVLMSAKADREGFLVNNACLILGETHDDMSLEDFLSKVDQPEMQEFFKGIGANPSEAARLFSVVDADDSGTINAEEFLNGVVRLHGPAKALDTAVLVQSVHNILSRLDNLEKEGVDAPWVADELIKDLEGGGGCGAALPRLKGDSG